MWALKQLYDKGLLYEGYRVLPYCWECETPLSNFETRLDDAYRDRQDPALTVWFELDDAASGCWCGRRRRGRCRRTSPSPSVPTSTTPCSSEARRSATILGEATVRRLRTRAGRRRRGWARSRAPSSSGAATRRCSPSSPTAENAFVVLAGDFVTTEDGTGVVHMAPGFGEDDQRLSRGQRHRRRLPGRRAGPVHRRGARLRRASRSSTPTPTIIRDLKDRGVVVRHETYVHSYPHCWRTDTPLIYRAVSSWFVKVTAIKDRMLELNQQITWVPEHVRDGSFGKWLEGRPRLVDQPQPLLGLADPGVEERRPRLPADRRLRQPRRARARLRRAARRPAPARHRRADAARTPTTRPASRRCAASRTSSTAGSSRGRCRSPRCTTRSRTRSGSSATSPATSSSSTSARPAAGSTRCTCWRPRCSTGPRSRPASSTASCSATTARSCRSGCSNYPDPVEVFDTVGVRRHALGAAARRRWCAAATSSSIAAHGRSRSARCCCRSGTRGTS